MSTTVLYKEILFGGAGGVMTTDSDFVYDPTSQTLYVENLEAANLSFSGEILPSPTFTGAITLGSSGSDTMTINATTTIATVTTLSTTTKLQFRDTGLFIYSQSDGKLTISSDGVGSDDITMTGTVTFGDAVTFSAAVTHSADLNVGVNGTGYDVTFYGDTSGKKWEFLQSTDTMKVTASSSFQGTVAVGVDDTGFDVTFYGATTGKYFLWDESADGVVLVGSQTMTGNLAVTGTTTITSTNASALTVGRQGATDPVLKVVANTASVATGISITGAAAAAGVAITAISSGTNENMTIDAKGSGTISLGATSTGAIVLARATGITGAATITSASAASLTVGLNGATNPAFTVDSSTGSQAAGFKVTGAVTGGTVALVATDSGSNTNVTLNAKGSGTIGIGTVSTGAVTITPATTITGALTNTGALYANGGVDRSTAAALAIGATNATSVVVTPATTITGALTLTAGIAAKVIFTGTETIAAGGTTTALDLTKTIHNIDADAGGDIFTLADGVAGQTMFIIMKTSTGTATITPATKTGFTSVTFNAAGDSVILQFYTTLGWIIMGGNSYAVV
jgi:hypothetical protein